jgi:hypothetical protein
MTNPRVSIRQALKERGTHQESKERTTGKGGTKGKKIQRKKDGKSEKDG